MAHVSGRDEWLRLRTSGIGGSDASVILGINPWKSKLELWTEKVTGNMIEKDNPDLHWGKKLEPFIIEEYIELTKRDVESGMYELENIRSKEYPWMIANLDGRILDKIKGKGVLECKTKSAYIHWDSDIPTYYHSQIQHYFAVTGYTWGSFAVLDFGKKNLYWRDVERDDTFIENLIRAERNFWELVVNKTPPIVDGSEACEDFLRNTYPEEDEGKDIDLTSNVIATNWAYNLKTITDEIKLCKERENECKSNLMSVMKDAEVGIGNGYKITWKRPKDKVVFDDERFEEENPELYERYIKRKKQTRRFTIRFAEAEATSMV